MALESTAERAVVRFDEKMRNYPLAEALRQSLLRIECIATVRTDGLSPDYAQIVFLELAKKVGVTSSREQKMFLYKYFPYISKETSEASFEAFRCLETLKYIACYEPQPQGLTLLVLKDVYSMCFHGTKREADAGFRTQPGEQKEIDANNIGISYIPPNVEDVLSLLDDLLVYCNQEKYSAMNRSIVEHFQLEAIKPVKIGGDRLGRMLALLLWRQCGIVENFLPPFSATPAVQTKKHTELLIPYQTGKQFEKQTAMMALDNWCAHSARAVIRSVKLSEIYREKITELECDWRERTGNVRSGSLLDELITALLILPATTITNVSIRSGKQYLTAAEAVEKLVEVGILKQQSDVKRNRLFIAEEVLKLMTDIEKAVLPDIAVAREDFFES